MWSVMPEKWCRSHCSREDFQTLVTWTPSPCFLFWTPFSSCWKAVCSKQLCLALCLSPVAHKPLAIFRFPVHWVCFLILLLVNSYLMLPCFTQNRNMLTLCCLFLKATKPHRGVFSNQCPHRVLLTSSYLSFFETTVPSRQGLPLTLL